MQVKAHSKNDKEIKEVRYMTLEEAKNLHYGDHVLLLDNKGCYGKVKINGSPKIWKTRPSDCEISWKYGLYEYGKEKFTEYIKQTNLVVEV